MNRIFSALGPDRLAVLARLALLATPIALMHGHAIADGLIGLCDLLFLVHCARQRDFRWITAGWGKFAFAWWGWIVIATLIAGRGGAIGQALALVRFFIFAAALEHYLLATETARRWFWNVIAASAAWIGGSALLQFFTGRNLFGFPPGGDGELTGPFGMPRAAPPLSRIILPVLLPPAARLLARRDLAATAGAYALLLGGLCIMALIGQRMPMMLTVLGLLIAAVLLPRLRRPVLVACAAAALLIAASPIVSPPTYHRMVEKFSVQMEHFPSSEYGKVFTRAWEMGRQNPVAGLGYDGFRRDCADPRYWRATFDGAVADGGGRDICFQHPHNFYAQAWVEGGLPGLILFIAAAVAWLIPLACSLWSKPDPLRVGLFAAVVIQLWPLASTSAFFSMPMGGWFFLTLGWALAVTRWRA